MSERLDAVMFRCGMAKSRTLSQTLIKNGQVTVNGKVILKPSSIIGEEDEIIITGSLPRFVGRGGEKLEKAITDFAIDLQGLVCLDVGASTGGFTDCMLYHGAKKVYAVDVGQGQLDETLLRDDRVVSLEKLDIRQAGDRLPEVDFAAVDVSFISLKLILPAVKKYLFPGRTMIALVKPQFEVGRKNIGKNGIVKDKKAREKALEDIKVFSQSLGFQVLGSIDSPILGGDGNQEYLLILSI